MPIVPLVAVDEVAQPIKSYPVRVGVGNVTALVLVDCVKHGYNVKLVVLFAPKLAPLAWVRVELFSVVVQPLAE